MKNRKHGMMNARQKADIMGLGGGIARFGYPMAEYTTFRIGGKAEVLYESRDLENLQNLVVYLGRERIPYLVVGKGSNLLVMDGGIEGVAIKLGGDLAAIRRKGQASGDIAVGAGMSLWDLLAYCSKANLGGLEFLAGIPGSVGGALIMNAGAYGHESAERVKEISIVRASGEVARRHRSELAFSYRNLDLEKGSVVFQARFEMDQEDESVVAERVAGHLKKRKETQPLGYPSAGSVFKNPPHGSAWQLIEEVGLKGARIGGAMISVKHSNFIVNTGGARAKDVLALLRVVQSKVKAETGVQLEPEIRIVGT